MDDTKVTIDSITRHSGIAGQYAYTVRVTYRHSDGTAEQSVARFVSSEYGAPVVMVTNHYPRGLHVHDCWQYGAELDPAWIRAFYAVKPAAQ